MKKLALVVVLALAGCVETVPQEKPVQAPAPVQADVRAAVSRFESVLRRVEPVAESVCKQRTQGVNCDYLIKVDTRPDLQPNAYQSEDRSGRPLIVFTSSLLLDVRNNDELALIMGHEAAHHIEGHLTKKKTNAVAGALIFGILGAAIGVDYVQTATDIGASVGARSYSKEFELEADKLGTVIAKRAGYDPVRGAAYFTRIPDPGNSFLGTHPPNANRIATIRQAARG